MSFSLGPIAPFRLDFTAWALRRQKARALIEASRNVAYQQFGQRTLEALDDAAAVQRLHELHDVAAGRPAVTGSIALFSGR